MIRYDDYQRTNTAPRLSRLQCIDQIEARLRQLDVASDEDRAEYQVLRYELMRLRR